MGKVHTGKLPALKSRYHLGGNTKFQGIALAANIKTCIQHLRRLNPRNAKLSGTPLRMAVQRTFEKNRNLDEGSVNFMNLLGSEWCEHLFGEVNISQTRTQAITPSTSITIEGRPFERAQVLSKLSEIAKRLGKSGELKGGLDEKIEHLALEFGAEHGLQDLPDLGKHFDKRELEKLVK